MIQKIISVIFLLVFVIIYSVNAQQFNGVRGSVFNSVVNTSSQPASGGNMPAQWSLEILGSGAFWDNNIVRFHPLKIWKKDSIDLSRYLEEGDKRRYAMVKGNIHILNFLFRLPKHPDWTVGMGWNIRSHTYGNNTEYAYNTEMRTAKEFFRQNALNDSLTGRAVNQQWAVWYFNASKVVNEDDYSKMTVGASLKLIKGMGAEMVEVTKLQAQNLRDNVPNYTSFIKAKGQYGYSQNLDNMDNDKAFLHGSPLSIGLDAGFVYKSKTPVLIPGMKDKNQADYNWKLSVALTDWGRLKYTFGQESRQVNGVKNPQDISNIHRMINDVGSLEELNDTLRHVFNMSPQEGTFTLSLPTMLHIGFDKNIGRHFYLNTHLGIDASFLNFGVDYKSKSLSYLTVTPRWEKKRIGVYVPAYLNEKGRFLLGTAVRLGPLMLGVHDFGWIFDKTRSGGAYFALVINGFSQKKECECF